MLVHYMLLEIHLVSKLARTHLARKPIDLLRIDVLFQNVFPQILFIDSPILGTKLTLEASDRLRCDMFLQNVLLQLLVVFRFKPTRDTLEVFLLRRIRSHMLGRYMRVEYVILKPSHHSGRKLTQRTAIVGWVFDAKVSLQVRREDGFIGAPVALDPFYVVILKMAIVQVVNVACYESRFECAFPA